MSWKKCAVIKCPNMVREGLRRFGPGVDGQELADGRTCWRCRARQSDGKPKKPMQKGTAYVNGSCLGPAERDPATGNIEQGPHITRKHAKNGDIAVIAIDRSPMNAKRWSLTLSCGHEIWMTSSRKPKTKTAKCEKCEAK